MTMNRKIFDGTGAFLQGELEVLDPQIHLPLNLVTWHLDVLPRKDVSIGYEHTSFTNSTYGAVGGMSTSGKSWMGKAANSQAGTSLDIQKVTQDLYLWGQEVSWTTIELEQAAILNRPVDVDKVLALNVGYQQDIDNQVYLGDADLGVFGFANCDLGSKVNSVTNVSNALTGGWASATPAQILADVRELETSVWKTSGYKAAPTKMLVPASAYPLLLQPMVIGGVSLAVSIKDYIATNSLCLAQNGVALDIQPRKWLDPQTPGVVAAGVTTGRLVAYTPDYDKVRFPVTPLLHTPIEFTGIYQKTTYYSKMGSIEIVYPSTIGIRRNIN